MDPQHLARQAEQHFAAIGDVPHVAYEGRWFTRGELFERACRVAGGLLELGVARGDRVVVVMANSPDVGVVYQALWRIGAVATPAIFLLPPAELRHIVTDAGATTVVASADFLAAVQAAVEGLEVTLVVDGPTADGVATLEMLATGSSVPIADGSVSGLAALLYTGGTTGRSKGVMLTHANLWHAGRSGYEATLEDPHFTRTLVPLPLAHAFGLVVTAVGMHNDADQTSVLMRWFDPAGALALMAQHRIEQATLVPTMLALLLAQPLEDHDLSSLRRVLSGSAPLAASIRDAFEDRVPSVTVCEGYGLTETTAAATADRMSRRRKGTVGQALPGVELRVVDDSGDSVAVGEPGEILVRSPTVAAGYWRAPEATAATFVAGWCHTGDVGSLDPDGYLRILDRKKDLIIRGGFNVYPRDVEDAMREHPCVEAVGVVGRPDRVYGEEIVAFVVPGAPIDVDELREWGRARLGPKAYPRDVRLVDALPLTPVLKLDRKALRTLL